MEGGARGERDYDGDYDSEFRQRVSTASFDSGFRQRRRVSTASFDSEFRQRDSRPGFDGEFGDRR